MSIDASLASLRARRPQDQPDRHPGRAELRRRRARRAARRRRRGRRRQRRSMGVEVSTERLWRRADAEGLARLVFVNMLDRERADFFAALDSLKAAFGPHVVATEIPIGAEQEVRGVIDLIDMKAFVYEGDGPRRTPSEVEIPEELRGAGRGVPREADGRGRRELRRADGALPRGRGDRPRGDRRRRSSRGVTDGHDLPGHLRRRDPEPRHRPPARGAGRGPALAGDARRRSRPLGAEGEAIEIEPDEDGAAASPTSSRPSPTPTRGGSTSSASTAARSRSDSHVVNVDPPPEGADRPARPAARQGPGAGRPSSAPATSARSRS